MAEWLHALWPLLATVVVVVGGLKLAHWLLLGRDPSLGNERRLPRQVTMLGLGIGGTLAVALALPVSESTRNQLIALIGVLVSGVIAFSSTTVVANLMAGLMLRMTKAFRTGDFIRVGEHFGRVTERGLFDTEIQTERRELVAIANTYLIQQPVTVLHASGTIVSAELSLGYELHHARVEKLLLAAAAEAGLSDPFVQVIALGDFSVSYRVSGLLTEVKSVLSARSRLHREILDTLHADGIEIVSPSFMNQRPQATPVPAIPPERRKTPVAESTSPEDIVFDKAEEAEQRERQLRALAQDIQRLQEALAAADAEQKADLGVELEAKKAELAGIQAQRAEQEASDELAPQAPHPAGGP